MDMLLPPLLASALTLWGTPTTWLEVLAFVLTPAMVVSNLCVNPRGWSRLAAASH